ncbi:MAG: cyclic nucleotide-binding domain-containing protein [Acidobacteria bacterium]|nr:cyclic nucleotide-binding domain-containing protein [Acidobacteriota bacterium]
MVSHPLKDFIVRFKSGDRIYREGDRGSEMFIVQSGAVEIYRDLGDHVQVLAVMEKGDFFGEMSVLEGTPRTACARAAEDSEVIEITSAIFDRMIRGNIEIAVRMLRKLSSRLQESQWKMDTPQADGTTAANATDLDRSLPLVRDEPVPPTPVDVGGGSRIQLPPDCMGALILGEGEQVFPIKGEVCLIGRYDPVTGTRPEIDLTPFDTNRSVSRRHARVTASGSKLFISEEVGALNGTFLNGKRLTPGKSEPLQSGDTLALGMVLLKLQGR